MNNLPDIIAQRNIPYQPSGVSPGYHAPKTGANTHRLIGMAHWDIFTQGYDLSINRYKKTFTKQSH